MGTIEPDMKNANQKWHSSSIFPTIEPDSWLSFYDDFKCVCDYVYIYIIQYTYCIVYIKKIITALLGFQVAKTESEKYGTSGTKGQYVQFDDC